MEAVLLFFQWWGPWLFLAAIPGIANVMVAWRQLVERCKFLPFFSPTHVPGFWLWLLIQFLAPGVTYWMSMGLQSRPNFEIASVGKAFAFGLGFVALMNARTKLDKIDINIQAIYDFFVRLAYSMIASRETSRTALFRTALEAELLTSTHLQDGVSHLVNYVQSDISIVPEEQSARIKKLETWRGKVTSPPQAPQIRELIALIEVRRKDLRVALGALGCSDQFLNSHFP